MSRPVLAVRGLSLRLPAGSEREHALTNVSLHIEAGEVLCLVGASGSGKSMLANAILGLLPKGVHWVAGEIDVGGTPLRGLGPAQWRALRGNQVAMVFQEPMSALNPVLRIGRQLDETLRAHGVRGTAQRRARCLALLAYVGLPDPPALYQAYPHQLSGGQRQRVVIAIALALRPALLVADEPTSALDVTTQAQILELLQRVRREQGMAVLMITHDFAVVEAIADRVVVMEHGHAVEQGRLHAVLGRPAHPYTQRLLAARELPPQPPQPATQGPQVLAVAGLGKTYRRRGSGWRSQPVVALAEATLGLQAGHSLAVVGESGSGKTTLGRALVRLLRPDSGTLNVLGTDWAALGQGALRPLRGQVQMVFQDPFASLNPRQAVGQQLMAGPLAHGTPRAEAEARVRRLLDQVGLPASAFERYPQAFSGGQRQRIGIARALAVQPRILVADECVSALDALVQQQVLALLAQLQRQLGLSLVFITHDLRVAAHLCGQVAVMQAGRIVEQGSTAQVLHSPQHAYTRRLLAAAGLARPVPEVAV